MGDIAVAKFYAQSWLLTHYFMSDALGSQERYKQLRAYMKAVGEGTDSVTAMQKATGLTIKELEMRLIRYTKERLWATPFEAKKLEDRITVTPLSKAADELMLDAIALKGDPRGERGEALLASIRKKASAFPGDRFAEVTLALAELSSGDPMAAQAMMEKRLESSPDDVEALDYAASARFIGLKQPSREEVLARAKVAQPMLIKAFKADPTRFQTLFTYVQVRQMVEPNYPSDNTLEVLLQAQALAPQVPTIRLEAARALLIRKKEEEARALLAPLINSPHGGGAAEAARALIGRMAVKPAAAPASP
jgi:hypothetical protein